MDVTATLDAPCPPARLFTAVDRLDGYPSWMRLAHAVRAVGDDDGRPSWLVELRAQLGPLARSKRLRMVRTVHDPEAGIAVFERHETDGRRHSPWVLRAEVTDLGDVGSRLTMRLHYGGALWTGGLMERVLGDQITAGRARLLAQLAEPTPPGDRPHAAPG